MIKVLIPLGLFFYFTSKATAQVPALDEPQLGHYYGEQIDVIISINKNDNTPEKIEQLKREVFDKISPYKILQPKYITTQDTDITNSSSLHTEIKKIATYLDNNSDKPIGHKFLLLIWTPYWEQGDSYHTNVQEGKYIYSLVVMRNALFRWRFPEPSYDVLHEIGHAFGLKGDNNMPNGDDSLLRKETVMDYSKNNETLAVDELKAITHLQFNNNIPSGIFLSGCRQGKTIYWYHKYQNTTTPHNDYSATWKEVQFLLPKLSKKEYINKELCK